MELCLEKLPPNSARAFTLCELFEVDSEEICTLANIFLNCESGAMRYVARWTHWRRDHRKCA